MIPSTLGLLSLFLYTQIQQACANSGQIFVTTSLVNFDARIVEVWSGGGGERWMITNDSNHPFSGREFGAADRSTLKGTQTFGSGYPYGDVDNTTIAGRPFPYGLWPLYWGNNTMGSDEYGPVLDGVRPGGQLVTIPLKAQGQEYNIPEDEIYYIIGDRDSALFLMISLFKVCDVAPAWPSKFEPTSPNSTLRIENVIQYYRASSFALASPLYNNSYARTNRNTESMENSPIPDVIRLSKFHQCIDDKIVDALAIMNWPPNPAWDRAITYIIAFSLSGLPILGVLYCLGLWWRNTVRGYRQTRQNEKEQRVATLAAREETIGYEHYP
ncbi:hypothetical protein M408DRAFT_333944 [Serendipita vermifera MAFF 305830]|uniref:Glycoside hydrolase family 16 protein n=1 Tax=Serendipita vermifera MAFF 305830 TaxID=933852 RepID=A0A0C3AMM4_SERVB|nr:hypothetical protein M408DRAFT_333944 [Serendipita vermifera MAFF 305830]